MNELSKLTDDDAERCVIGSVLIDARYLPAVREVLAPEDFANALHRIAYRAMLALADRGAPADDVFAVLWEMEALGGAEAHKPSLMAWSLMLPTACHARWYAERVRDLAERRRMLMEAQRLAGDAMDRSKPVQRAPRKGGVAL